MAAWIELVFKNTGSPPSDLCYIVF